MTYRNVRPTEDEPEVPPDNRLILWPSFLRISPSYHAAHLLRTEQIAADELFSRYPSFDDVLTTYDHFGDVFGLTVNQWWHQNSIRLFSSGFSQPLVKYIGFAQQDEEVKAHEFHEGLRQYIDVSRPNMNNPSMIILAMPIHEPKEILLKTVSDAIDFYREVHGPRTRSKKSPLFELSSVGVGKAFNGLEQCLQLVSLRAKEPTRDLWEYGYMLGVGRAARKIIDSKKSTTDEIVDAKSSLAQSTSKIYRQALVISESAARGNFPVIDQGLVGNDVNFDLKIIAQIIEKYGEWLT